MKIKLRTVVSVFAIIVIMGGLIVWSRSTSKDGSPEAPIASTANSLRISESSYDFGTISMKAGTVQHVFTLANMGSTPVPVSKFYSSCMCTTAILKKGDKTYGPFGMPGHGSIPSIDETLEPGEEAELDVTFDPAAHGPAGVGKIDRVVTVEGPSGKLLSVRIAAFVTP